MSWMTFLVLAWVTLRWNANTEPDLRTYRLYERCSPASRLDLASPFSDYTEVGLVTTWRTEVEYDVFCYFTMTVVNTAGLESEASNMIFIIFVPTPVVSAPWLEWLHGE